MPARPRLFFPVAAFVIATAGGVTASYQLGESYGRAEQKRATVVRIGAPYYRGAYFGECARWSGSDGAAMPADKTVEACATDVPETEATLPPGESIHFALRVEP